MEPGHAPLLQTIKAAAAAIATWFICEALFADQIPIFGTIAALISVQENVNNSLTRGLERVVGVLLGVSVTLGAVLLFGQPSWLFIAALFVSLAVGWSLRMTNSSTNQIAITALLMIALGSGDANYGISRLTETAIGAVVGIAINALIVAPVSTSPVHAAINNLSFQAAEVLRGIAAALEKPKDPKQLDQLLINARSLHQDRAEVHHLLRSARESLKLNPRGTKFRAVLKADDELFQVLQPIVTQIVGMTRALYDHYDEELPFQTGVEGLADEMRRAAHDLELISTTQVFDEGEQPALTAPYTIAMPDKKHWVLIGSLMEDLRRIRERIVASHEK